MWSIESKVDLSFEHSDYNLNADIITILKDSATDSKFFGKGTTPMASLADATFKALNALDVINEVRDSAEKELEDTKKELEDTKKELEDTKNKYKTTVDCLNETLNQLHSAEKELVEMKSVDIPESPVCHPDSTTSIHQIAYEVPRGDGYAFETVISYYTLDGKQHKFTGHGHNKNTSLLNAIDKLIKRYQIVDEKFKKYMSEKEIPETETIYQNSSPGCTIAQFHQAGSVATIIYAGTDPSFNDAKFVGYGQNGNESIYNTIDIMFNAYQNLAKRRHKP